MNKKAISTIAIVLIAVVIVAAVGAGIYYVLTMPKSTSETMKIALFLPWRKDDYGWNQLAYNSLTEVSNTEGANLTVVENVNPSDIEAAMRDFAGKGYKLIVAHGYQFVDLTLKVAKDYPKTYFACHGLMSRPNETKALNNAFDYMFAFEEPAYVYGVLAALYTTSNKVGFVGPVEVPSQANMLYAYSAAINSTKSGVQINSIWTGDWLDVAGAKEATLAEIDLGCDIILQTGDGLALGAIAGASQRTIPINGMFADQFPVGPTVVYTSFIFNAAPLIEEAMPAIKAGGEVEPIYLGTIANGAISFTPFSQAISAATITQVQGVIDSIKNGTLTAPRLNPYT